MELKPRATRGTTAHAFSNLVAMINTLNYPLRAFINIDSPKTWTGSVPGSHRNRFVCLASRLDENGEPQVVHG